MKSWVDISLPGRHGERHRLADDGTTIGSSSSADIEVSGATGMLSVHCYLRPQREGCWIELIDSAPEPFTHEGKQSRAALVPWGHDAFLGSIRLTVAADTAGEGRKRVSPLLWIGALALPLLAASFLLKPSAGALVARSAVPDAPPLFGALPACSEEQAGALGRAGVAEQVARAKHERGVFELDDLVASVQLMREAAVCFALGGNQGSSDRTLDLAEAWISDLQFSYKRAQLDLEVGRRANRPREILKATGRLKTLLAHAGPEAQRFRNWIDQQRREQLAALAQRKKK
jgi:hypothetical protein